MYNDPGYGNYFLSDNWAAMRQGPLREYAQAPEWRPPAQQQRQETEWRPPAQQPQTQVAEWQMPMAQQMGQPQRIQQPTMQAPRLQSPPAQQPHEMQRADEELFDVEVSLQRALPLIEQAVEGEAEDRLFYQYLISAAPDARDKDIIAGIRNDEMTHFRLFRQLYYELTGQTLSGSQEADFKKPSSYCEGLGRAIMGEQNAVAKYRKILYGMTDRKHINMMTKIITDELRHLGLYNYLFAKNGCR